MIIIEGDDLQRLKHLKTTYPKPVEGEVIPITFIDKHEVFAGWSPQLKRTVYKHDYAETTGLKRVREVILLEVYNWLLDGISFIELSETELEQFKEVLEIYNENGGEIVYTRKREKQRMINYFRLVESVSYKSDVKKTTMAEIL